jgi:BMFP domain-containing protein YqiC
MLLPSKSQRWEKLKIDSCKRWLRHPDVVVREIDVDVKRQVGLAYSAARPASDLLRDFIAKLEKQHPAARRGKRAAAGKRG